MTGVDNCVVNDLYQEKAEQGKATASVGYLYRFGSVFSKAGGLVSMVSGVNKKEVCDVEIPKDRHVLMISVVYFVAF
jgi:hypothetical protein